MPPVQPFIGVGQSGRHVHGVGPELSRWFGSTDGRVMDMYGHVAQSPLTAAKQPATSLPTANVIYPLNKVLTPVAFRCVSSASSSVIRHAIPSMPGLPLTVQAASSASSTCCSPVVTQNRQPVLGIPVAPVDFALANATLLTSPRPRALTSRATPRETTDACAPNAQPSDAVEKKVAATDSVERAACTPSVFGEPQCLTLSETYGRWDLIDDLDRRCVVIQGQAKTPSPLLTEFVNEHTRQDGCTVQEADVETKALCKGERPKRSLRVTFAKDAEECSVSSETTDAPLAEDVVEECASSSEPSSCEAPVCVDSVDKAEKRENETVVADSCAEPVKRFSHRRGRSMAQWAPERAASALAAEVSSSTA